MSKKTMPKPPPSKRKNTEIDSDDVDSDDKDATLEFVHPDQQEDERVDINDHDLNDDKEEDDQIASNKTSKHAPDLNEPETRKHYDQLQQWLMEAYGNKKKLICPLNDRSRTHQRLNYK